MNALRARLRETGSEDRGLSMVELLVVLMITGILMTIIGTLFVNVARVTANSNSTTSRSTTAANLMDAVTKVIRTASNNAVATSEDADPAVVAGTASTLSIISYVDASPTIPAPTKVNYRVDGSGNLVEDRYSSTQTAGYWVFGTTAKSRVFPGPVLTGTGDDALFVYLDSENHTIIPGTSGLSVTQRALVASIKVNIRIANPLTTGADPIVLVNTVGMPNLNVSRTDN